MALDNSSPVYRLPSAFDYCFIGLGGRAVFFLNFCVLSSELVLDDDIYGLCSNWIADYLPINLESFEYLPKRV